MNGKYRPSIVDEYNEILTPFQLFSGEARENKSAETAHRFSRSPFMPSEAADIINAHMTYEQEEDEAPYSLDQQYEAADEDALRNDEFDIEDDESQQSMEEAEHLYDQHIDTNDSLMVEDAESIDEALDDTESESSGGAYFQNLLTNFNDRSDFSILYAESDPFGKSIYINPDLKITGTTRMTGIFVPAAFNAADQFELIIYLHGFKYDTSKNSSVCYQGICRDTTIDGYWKNPMFPLREMMQANRRNAILVAPNLSYVSRPGNLVLDRGFDLFINQVLRALCCENAISPCHTIGRIILAGHSGGGDVMIQLVEHKDKFARQINECWCFDALYGGTSRWIKWLKADTQRTFYSYYLGKTPANVSASIKNAFPNSARVYIKASDIKDHWDMVKTYWKERVADVILQPEISEDAEIPGEYEGVEMMTYESGKAPAAVVTTCDPDVAIPEFENSQKQKIDPLLLSAKSNAKVIAWNKAFLKKTRIDASTVRSCLARYVDLSMVQHAIDAFNVANPSKKIDSGTAPVDAVFAEAVHQFQKKVYFDTSRIDGKAGAGTLQSMGIISVPASRSANAHAEKELKRLGIKVSINGTECNYRNWFSFTYNPSFLGVTFNATVHYLLIRQLRVAEKSLLSLPRFKGDSLVELAVKLGLSNKTEKHQGGRSGDSGMHIYGLAVDIDHNGNPWIGAGWIKKPTNYSTLDAATRSRIDRQLSEKVRFVETLRKATADVLTGSTIFAYLDSIGINQGADTTNAYKELKKRNDEFIAFLKTDAAELKFWKKSATFGGRDPLNGFLNLDADLVHALRQVAGLAWGAIDFGAAANGDIMHFDMRTIGIARTINTGKRPQAGADPSKTHPLLRTGTDETKAMEETYGHNDFFYEENNDYESYASGALSESDEEAGLELTEDEDEDIDEAEAS